MTFEWKRYDIQFDMQRDCIEEFGCSDGDWVKSEDAINREAVNEAKIRTLETQLKDARAALASNKAVAVAVAVAVDFPYQRTFDAIAAATKIEAGHIAISVRAFTEAYNK